MPSPIEGRPAAGAPGHPEAGPSPRAFTLCLLVCASLQIAENLLPRVPVFPWLKPGLSHVVLLPFLLRFGPRQASALLLGRNLLTLLFAAGSLSSFLLGTVSGLAALLAGGGLVRAAARRGWLGMAGAGMLMAALMNLGLLAAAEALIVHHAAFRFQLAPLLLWSVASGAGVAWLALRCRPALEELFAERGDALPATPRVDGRGPEGRGAEGSPAAFVLVLAALAGLFLLPGLPAQGAALLALAAVSAARGFLRTGFRNVLRGWPWFLYLAWLHLLLGDGLYLEGLPGVLGRWVTREGAADFLLHSARLASLILLGPHLAAAFPRRWLAGSRAAWARGALAALPLLPGLHAAAVGSGRAFLRAAAGRGAPEGGVSEVLRALADGFRGALAETGRAAPAGGRAAGAQ